MDISLLPKVAVAEEFTSASFIALHINRWLHLYLKQLTLSQCDRIPLLFLLHTFVVNTFVVNTSKRKLDIFYTLFISLLLSSHVVFANTTSRPHLHDEKDHRNSDGNKSREERYAGASSSSAALVLKPEYFTIPIGGVIHLFPRYGYLSLSMKVIARNTNTSTASSATSGPQNDSWIFLEPVNNVIEPTTLKTEETSFSPVNDSESLPFHNLFHFDLCEDIQTLQEAYFKNFSIEGLDKPWQAFAGGWRTASIARNYGIDQQFVEGDYRYILVKVLLVRASGTVKSVNNSTVSENYKSNFNRFTPDNDLSTYEFFKIVGTHYIHSYISGNAVYQVFVYDPDGFQSVKRRLFFEGINDDSTAKSAERIIESLSTWVKHIGRVIVLNAEPSVSDHVRKSLFMHNSYSTPGPNLFKLHDNATLVKEIESLLSSQPSGILAIDFRGIQFLFSESVKRTGFEKALKHKMQLWEINFLY